MKISRQREWQIRKMAHGLCPGCGKKSLDGVLHCKICSCKGRNRYRKKVGSSGRMFNGVSYDNRELYEAERLKAVLGYIKGKTMKELADEYRVSVHSIKSLLTEHAVNSRKPGPRPKYY